MKTKSLLALVTATTLLLGSVGCKKEDVKDKVLKFMFTESDKYGNLTAACPIKKVNTLDCIFNIEK